MIPLNDYQIILASGSSRRKDFLESLSIPFTIKTNQVDETFPPELKGKKIAEFIVRQKMLLLSTPPAKANCNYRRHHRLV